MAVREQAEMLWMDEGEDQTGFMTAVERSRRRRQLEATQRPALEQERSTRREQPAHQRSGTRDDLAAALERAATGHGGARPLSSGFTGPLPASDEDVPLVHVVEARVTFEDLVLTAENTTLCREIIREYRNRGRLAAYGLRPRRRLLLAGPSGTGKTRTAEALASSLGLPLVRVNLSAVVSSYLGQTARHLERILDFASRSQCVVSFDEFDMLAASRDDSDHGEMRRVATVLLQQLENYASDNLVVATTNHADLLDEAIWRRFDEVLIYRMPTQKQIAQLVKIKLRRFEYKINQEQVAQTMSGLSHAQVEAVCLDAMRAAVLSGAELLTTEDLQSSTAARKKRFREAGKSLG
ncbi:AAA family ATPase [Streptomyces olivaceoviridis]|uniref:AAA family ATPase n=1 Tax=Streptomyces olivaceoviridis TaxID=1921 RepID=UPI00331D3F44